MSDADVKMPEPAVMCDCGGNYYTADQLRAAVLAERERCAKLADEYATWGGSNFAEWFRKCAAAIREGGK